MNYNSIDSSRIRATMRSYTRKWVGSLGKLLLSRYSYWDVLVFSFVVCKCMRALGVGPYGQR